MTPELTTVKIGQPASRALKAAGIHSLAQLCDYAEKDLLALHGVGPKAIRILKETLEKKGFLFILIQNVESSDIYV